MPEFLSSLYHLDALIRWGGYAVLFLIVFAESGLLAGFFLPGDSLLMTAGLIASVDGTLNIGLLVVLLSAAAVLGDSTGYAIGYILGPRIFSREDSRFFHRDHLIRTQQFYEKHGPKTIVLARFVPFVRTFAPTVAGVGRMRYRTFLTFNLLGGIGWVCGMTLTGYLLGESVPHMERYVHWLVLTVVLVSLLPVARELMASRRRPETGEPKVR